MNKGGSQQVAGLTITMTDARHSSGFVDGGQMVYMGEPGGFVIRLEDGRTVYFAGDTALFGDMQLIGQRHKPEIAFLPIGDRFTMDPIDAARACQLLGVKQVVPMHWGNVPDAHRHASRTQAPRRAERYSGAGADAGADRRVGPVLSDRPQLSTGP
jgi:L-ascorbate metabolism protein UlaG (beta-lactamase superfamily)